MIAHSVAEQLRLIDRAMTMYSRATEALLRARDEDSLLTDICRSAVEVAGYRMSWIGYARDDEAKTVAPVAVAGSAAEYLQGVRVSWADDPFGAGPTGRAIRSGVTHVLRDSETDPNFGPWREASRQYGFRSSIALPLGTGEQRLGVFTIYAAEPDSFDADAVRLLEDLARNLAYGIHSQRMKAEHDHAVRALAESEARYRSLIDLAPDAVLVHDHGLILFANQASAAAFGAASSDDLVNRSLVELTHPDSRTEIARRIAAPPPGRGLAQMRMQRLDGTPFDADVVGTTIAFEGRPARLSFIRDVTERTLAQEQLLAAGKLATLGEMASGLVHELSQPLNIMRLTAEGALLFIERGKATPEWQAQQFQLIADQAERTAEIIDDIRIFSRRDNGPIQVFDASVAVKAAAGVLQGQMRPDGITVTTAFDATPLPVRGRRVQLEQVVMNLLANAHHALKEKRDPQGNWHPEVRISTSRDGRDGRIVIEDNGPGIPPALRERIFEPFFTTKEAGRGTGLGLSVSFGIVKSMGGRLVSLERPVGACFAVTLPLSEVDGIATDTDTDMPQASAPAATAADSHILVVDDEKAAGDGIAQYLAELGYRTTVCTSGTQAWQTFSRDPADVVVTDLRMPSGDGERLVEQLRDFDPLLPVIIVTGHLGATESLSEHLADDRCAVLKKPVALARLGELIAGFLIPPA